MKRKKVIALIVILCILLLAGTVVFLVFDRNDWRIPYIAFMENSTREDCLYICSDGDIYAAVSEVAFTTKTEELEKKIKEKDYADILEFVGTTDADKVYEMHQLMCKVAIKEGYYFEYESITAPKGKEYGGKVRYWNGYYYNDEEAMEVCGFYRSNAGVICSDKRAYKIVEWMYDCLKEYME